MANKKCSKCSTYFTCHASSNGCWCEQYQVPTASLKDLKANFADCLCQDCLKEYTEVDNTKTPD